MVIALVAGFSAQVKGMKRITPVPVITGVIQLGEKVLFKIKDKKDKDELKCYQNLTKISKKISKYENNLFEDAPCWSILSVVTTDIPLGYDGGDFDWVSLVPFYITDANRERLLRGEVEVPVDNSLYLFPKVLPESLVNDINGTGDEGLVIPHKAYDIKLMLSRASRKVFLDNHMSQTQSKLSGMLGKANDLTEKIESEKEKIEIPSWWQTKARSARAMLRSAFVPLTVLAVVGGAGFLMYKKPSALSDLYEKINQTILGPLSKYFKGQ